MSFDESKYCLGRICKRGHEYADPKKGPTGKGLRYRTHRGCVKCQSERDHKRQKDPEYRERRRESTKRWYTKVKDCPVFREQVRARTREAMRKRRADPEKRRADLDRANKRRRDLLREDKTLRDSVNKVRRERYANDPEYRRIRREHNRKYGKTRRKSKGYREKARQYHRERYCNDDQYRIKHLLRARLANALRRYESGQRVVSIKYGIDYPAIFRRIGPKPTPDHVIDHIRPCSSFDLTDPEKVLECFSPENHRWIHRRLNGNSVKGRKTEEEFRRHVAGDPDLQRLWVADCFAAAARVRTTSGRARR